MELDGIKVQPVKIDKKQPIGENKSANTSSIQSTVPNYEGQYTPQMFGILPNFKLAKTLSQPPVSFKGAVLKKSDFKGTDLAVIERYKPNIQQFKSKEDLQTFAESKIRDIMLNPEHSKAKATLNAGKPAPSLVSLETRQQEELQVQSDELKDFGGRQEETKIQRVASKKRQP
jgi:hypothetical protein